LKSPSFYPYPDKHSALSLQMNEFGSVVLPHYVKHSVGVPVGQSLAEVQSVGQTLQSNVLGSS